MIKEECWCTESWGPKVKKSSWCKKYNEVVVVRMEQVISWFEGRGSWREGIHQWISDERWRSLEMSWSRNCQVQSTGLVFPRGAMIRKSSGHKRKLQMSCQSLSDQGTVTMMLFRRWQQWRTKGWLRARDRSFKEPGFKGGKREWRNMVVNGRKEKKVYFLDLGVWEDIHELSKEVEKTLGKQVENSGGVWFPW